MENGTTGNKYTGLALSECDRHVLEMFDNVHLIAVMLDLSGNIIYCNNFLCELTGWSKEHLLGRNWFDTCLPDTVRDTIKAYFLKSIKTGQITYHYENEIVTKAGVKKIILWSNSVLRGNNGECIGTTSIGEDITERKRAEALLRESEERYKTLVELTTDFIYMSDANGITTFMNDYAYKFLDTTPEEAAGKPWMEWIHPDDRLATVECFGRMMATGQDVFGFENRFVSKSGKVSYALHNVRVRKDADGNILGTQGIVRDITERKLAEESLRESEAKYRNLAEKLKESEAKFRSLVENSLIGVYIVQNEKFKYANPRLSEIVGYSEKELYELDLEKLIHPDEFKAAREKYYDRISGKVSSVHYQSRWIKKDKGIIDVELFGSAINYNGEPAILGEVLEVTDRKKAEEEREAMFHMLTHDMKGPLSVIYGYGEISSKMSPDDSVRIMADIQKAGRRIYAIIDDILSLSQLESKEQHLLIRPVFLHELVEQAVKENEAGAVERGITITVENAGAPPRIYADPEQLSRAVGNLVTNAVNYNKKGGNIKVSTGIASGRDNWIFIEVADDGDGIPEEDIPHIFEKYYRGKRSSKKRGTGLGLAIVKAAADAHGGKVELKSKAGEGSTFTITLPVKPGM